MARHDDEDEEVVVVRQGSSIAPLLVGIAIGAALGLLFAPMSGEELRAEIGRRGKRWKDLAADKAEEFEEALHERVQRTRRGVEDKVREGKQFAHDVTEAGKAAAVSARQELERRLTEAREARRTPRTSEEEPVA